MKNTHLLLLLVLLTGCNSAPRNEGLDQPYISSFTELSDECIRELIRVIEPIGFEDDTLSIKNIHLLDVVFDTTLYSSEFLKDMYFIGIELLPNSYEMVILNINLQVGSISSCQILDNDQIVINNMIVYMGDFSSLSVCDCFKDKEKLLDATKTTTGMFRNVIWANAIYGYWKPSLNKEMGFERDMLNGTWKLQEENEVILLDTKFDTILIDTFKLQGDILTFQKSKLSFELATRTNNKLIIRDLNSKRYVQLVKQIE